MEELKKYVGKVVATRGIGSGVNVGRLVAIEGATVILTEAYFMQNWKYANSFGAFDSLSTGDVTGGTIAKIKEDKIITDLAAFVVCPEELLNKCKKHAT